MERGQYPPEHDAVNHSANLREFECRHNLRQTPYLMFDCLLQAFPKVRVE
jgi:hypothetical protein